MMADTIVTERIPFRFLSMQCCGTLLCHVNHRLPMYCSGCGTRVWPDVKGWATLTDMNATLKYKRESE